LPRWAVVLRKPAGMFIILVLVAVLNAGVHPRGVLLSFVKDRVENPQDIAYMRWNSYSRVRAERTVHQEPHMWAPSPDMPDVEIDMRWMSIDGDAGTAMYRFGGDIESVGFLKYDISSIAYYLPARGKAPIIALAAR